MLRHLTVAVTALAVAVPATAAAAATTTKTVRLKGGSTALTLDPVAAANLKSMNIAMSGVAPAATAGTLLTFPVASGTVKVKGTKVLSGSIVHLGGLAMTQVNPATGAQLQVALSRPTVVFGALPSFTGALQGLAVPIATLKIKGTAAKLSRTSLKVGGVVARLTPTAASAMNATFSVTGFKAGDPVGTAVLTAKVRRG